VAVEINAGLTPLAQARLNKIMTQLARKAGDVSGALKNIGEALLETTNERFETGRDPEGRKWQPLSPLTVKIRGAAGPILWNTGRLKSSISYNVTGNVLELGPNTVDAAIHQFGGRIVPKDAKALRIAAPGGPIFAKKVDIPARPYIGFGPKDWAAAKDALEDWLDMEGTENIA